MVLDEATRSGRKYWRAPYGRLMRASARQPSAPLSLPKSVALPTKRDLYEICSPRAGMVNFKAGMHQGERKRALAAQGSAENNPDTVRPLKSGIPILPNSIPTCCCAFSQTSKNEKRALLARPWSNTDPLCRHLVNSRGLALQVPTCLRDWDQMVRCRNVEPIPLRLVGMNPQPSPSPGCGTREGGL